MNFHLTEDRFLYAQEDMIYNVTEDILLSMEKLNISKSELANRVGKTKSYISQLLNGSRNMTFRTFSDICLALGVEVNISLMVDGKDVSIAEEKQWHSQDPKDNYYLNGAVLTKTIDLAKPSFKKYESVNCYE